MLVHHLRRLLLEFIRDIESSHWFGKERELVSRFAFTQLAQNAGCCGEFYDSGQIGIEVRVTQVVPGKKEVCKDLVLWKFPHQTVWSPDNVPLCIMEWKHRYSAPAQQDVDWLLRYTHAFPSCLGIAVAVENEGAYRLRAVLIEAGRVTDPDWIRFDG